VSATRRRLVVLHGANLDMLGERPLEHYGSVTLREIEGLVSAEASERGWRTLCLHTNHEGSYIELLHKHRNEDGLLVNPGAWTHYSYAIRDALEIVRCPVAEVHLSDIASREEWRRKSVMSPVVAFTVSGRGPAGYVEAVKKLIDMVEAAASVERRAGGPQV
jgi:3-dehydroquinate dehydratase II